MSTRKVIEPIQHFEQALAELEGLVAQMEKGELSLADTVAGFERGTELARRCEEALRQAELKVEQLSNPADPDSAVPL
ncbi:MAG: exodeoxyribonuclease VII small subunit [Xanthomonadales bacterium]|jgi:exodeoxyribonuclease VII small subunit|nr:exodeoxyribonuclease VII small subunit [Xanthomonadales bacterium]